MMAGLRKMKKWLIGALSVSLLLILVMKVQILEQSDQADRIQLYNPSTTLNARDEVFLQAAPTIERFIRFPLFTLCNQYYSNSSDTRSTSRSITRSGTRFTTSSTSRPTTNLTIVLTIVSVWSQMEPVFCRLDCLPDALEGFRQAQIGWQDLMEELQSQTLDNSNNSSKASDSLYAHGRKQCPYSVYFDKRSAGHKNKEVVLQIPCGLMVGSSITIVGIPWGGGGNIILELLGPKTSLGEQNAPIILHYNVRLNGDKLTEDPVLIQNTWTEDHDWEDEVRCPLPWGEKNRVVDGLDGCSKEMGMTTERMDSGSENSKYLKWSNINMDKGKKPWFPFVNGYPFAATLWIGQEGFHMTVNGKHITSFKYRKNLEPSMVTGARLEGSLKLISFISNGLPMSKDALKILDLNFLKAPPLSSMQVVELFIGVFSTANNFNQRMAVRRSWMQYDSVRSGSVVVRFFVGLHSKKQVNVELWKEASTYGDVQLMPFVDYYNLITLKTIAICIFGTKMVHAKYIMKSDDDTFVRVDEVLAALKRTKHSKGLYYGFLEFDSKPQRLEIDKWFISKEEYPGMYYPPWAHGPGYIISKDVARFVVQAHKDKTLKLLKLEDISMGIWVAYFRRQGHRVYYIHDNRFNYMGCHDNYIIAHYQSPSNISCLWHNMLRGLGPLCCH